jgi:hypothetical protein
MRPKQFFVTGALEAKKGRPCLDIKPHGLLSLFASIASAPQRIAQASINSAILMGASAIRAAITHGA